VRARVDGKLVSVKTVGRLSIWVHDNDGSACVVYEPSHALAMWAAATFWFLSPAVRNALAHALNGNGEQLDPDEQDESYRRYVRLVLHRHTWADGPRDTYRYPPLGAFYFSKPVQVTCDASVPAWGIGGRRLMEAEKYSSPIPSGPLDDRVPGKKEVAEALVESGIESNPGWGEGNRFAVLANLSVEDALAIEDDAGLEGEAHDEPWDDDETYDVANAYAKAILYSHAEFEANPSESTAKRWNRAHSGVDSSDSDGRLSKGPRLGTKFQPAAKPKAPGKAKAKTRSPAMRARDASRLHTWLDGLNVDVAEAWVRANKPAEAAVPKNNSYLAAYAEGRTRSDYYGSAWKEDKYIGNVLVWIEDVKMETAGYLGPMTRGLIQTLLAIGNVELNPGPCVNGELLELWRYQNVEALKLLLDDLENAPAWPIRVVVVSDAPGFLGPYATPLHVVETTSAAYVHVLGDRTVFLVNTSDNPAACIGYDYVIGRDIRRQAGEASVVLPGLARQQYRYERNVSNFTMGNNHFHCHDDLFLHQGVYARLSILHRTNGIGFVHNQPCVSVFEVRPWNSPEPRSRHRHVVSPTVHYDVTPECIAVVVGEDYCSFDRELWNQMLTAVSGASFEDALRGFMARIKSSKTIDMNYCGHLSAAVSHAGAVNTRSIVTQFTRQRDSYHAAIADLQWGFWKFFRTNIFDYNRNRRYVWGDERLTLVHLLLGGFAAYGLYRLTKETPGMVYAKGLKKLAKLSKNSFLDTPSWFRRSVGHWYYMKFMVPKMPKLPEWETPLESFRKQAVKMLKADQATREMMTGKVAPLVQRDVVDALNKGDSSGLIEGVSWGAVMSPYTGHWLPSASSCWAWLRARLFGHETPPSGAPQIEAVSRTLSLLAYPMYKMVAPSFEERLVECGAPLHYIEVLFQPWKALPFAFLRCCRDPSFAHATFNACVEPTPYTVLPWTLMAGKRIMAMGAYAQFRGVAAKPGWRLYEPTTVVQTRRIFARTLLPSPYNLSAIADNPGNVEKAFVERHAMPVPGDDAVGRANKQRFWADVTQQVGHVESVDIMDVVADFDGGKRQLYYRAACEYMHLGLGDQARAARLESHLKAELAVAAEDLVDGQSSATPRAIQAHTVVQLLLQGTFMIPFTKRCSSIWGAGKDGRILGTRVVFASGCTRTEVSDEIHRLQGLGENFIVDNGDDAFLHMKDDEGRWQFISTDSSRHDAHVTRTDLVLKVEAYRQCGCPEDVYELWHDSLNRRGSFYSGRMPYKGDLSTVNSGSRCTTNGNGFYTAGALMEYIALKDVDLVKARCGLKLKVASYSEELADVNHEFCSGVFVPTEDGVAFSVKPGRAAARVAQTVTLGDDKALLQSKIDSLYLNLWAFPELQDVLRPHKLAELNFSYTQPGFKKPASLAVRGIWFYERYGQHYDEFVHEFGALMAGRLMHYHVIRAVAAVDYGTVAVPEMDGMPIEDYSENDFSLVSSRSLLPRKRHENALNFSYAREPLTQLGYAYRWLVSKILLNRRKRAYNGNGSRGWVLLLRLLFLLLWVMVVGTSCGWSVGHENLFPKQLLGYQQQIRQNYMPNKKAQQKSQTLKINNKPAIPAAPRKKGKRPQSARASSVRGAGLYSLVGPMAKMALQAAMPGVLANASRLMRPNASNISGHGDYVTNDIVHSGNSLPTKKGNAGVPTTTYTHSEYMKDLLVPATPTAFTSNKFNLNPTDAATFPWLSRLAGLFTKYRFTKLLFEFRTTTSTYSAAGTLGGVIMAPHYNVDSLAFATKQQMEAATHAVSSAPSNSVLMGFECAKKDNNLQWYNLLNDTTLLRNNFTDPGYVEISTNGLPGTTGTQLGELWVHYSIDLIEPYISVGDTVAVINGYAGGAYSNAQGVNSELTSNLLGMPITGAGINAYPAALFGTGGRLLSLAAPVGNYWVSMVAGTNQLSIQSAGVYIIDWSMKYNGTPTAMVGAPYDFSVVAGSAVVTTGNNSSVWSGSTFSGSSVNWRWVITVTTANTVLSTAKNSGWLFGTVIPTGSVFYITQID